MGYHVTIVRTIEGKINPISKNEILDLIDDNGDFSYKKHENYLNINKLGTDLYFVYQDGEIWVSNPSDEHIKVMIDIANKVGGRVRGDEYETYISLNDIVVHPDDESLIKKSKDISHTIKKNRNRRQFLINAGIFVFFLVMAVIVGILEKR